MEVSILKHEKEILINSEKRASDEVRSLLERVYRLQSSLDIIQSAEEVRENARAAEKKKHEEYLKQVEMEWAEAKKELQEVRDHVRRLTLDKEKAVENSVRQVEEMRKELADGWRAVASAESRAAVAEARCSDLEAKITCNEKQKVTKKDDGEEHSTVSTNEVSGELWKTKDELEKLREEARVNKEYMLQYKEIARTNEIALKQIESAHEEYKLEAEKLKKALVDEVESLRNKVHELESYYRSKSEESALAIESKEHALSSAMAETSRLRDEIAEKLSQIEKLEIQVSSLKDDVDTEHKRWRNAQDNYERQIILQSETIQELTNTSKELSILQCEITKLRECSEAQKSENELLRKSWEKEKAELEQLKSKAERKYNEVDEQNKILHGRLEALHIKLADKERCSSGLFSQSTDLQGENDLQNVISYLRRSKEIAETEMSLLKQEKLRLQSQLEVALKASENAQALLRSQSENSRTLLFKDEEFKSLQLQIREINLLRESNVQLRAENKHNFEESQKFREEAQKAKLEAEKFGILLHEREAELDACRKEVEMLKQEIGHLNSRITELREITKNVDIAEYERMKDELQHTKVLLQESESKVESTRNLVSEKQDSIVRLEQELAKCQSDLAEQEKKLNDALQAETRIKVEQKKYSFVKKKLESRIETLTKEKEELHYKNQAFLKQIEDSKSSRKNIGESSTEQARKDQEKDTRIQILEKTVERQKEDIKKERDDFKAKSVKSKSTLLGLLEKIKEEKTKVVEELAKHKSAIVVVLERSGMTTTQLPSGTNLDEQTLAYFQSIGNFEDFANATMNEGDSLQNLTTESLTVDVVAAAVSGRQVGTQLVRPSVRQSKAIEEKERVPIVSKQNIEVRKSGRKLIRPPLDTRLEHPAKPSTDANIPVAEPSSVADEGKPNASQEPEISADTSHAPSARKRPASSSLLEPREGSVAQEESSTDNVPSLKKSKHAEALESSTDAVIIYTPSETHDSVQQSTALSYISESQPVLSEDMETDQALTLSTDEITDEGKAEEDVIVNTKEETEDQQKESLGGTDPEDEAPYEGEAVMDELPDKPNASVEELSDKQDTLTELVDETSKSEDVKDLPQPALDSEDEREEGELIPDASEQQEDVSGDVPVDPTIGGGGEIGDESTDAAEVASPDGLAERSEEADVMEDVAEASDKHGSNDDDRGAPGSSQSPQRSIALNTNDQALPETGQSPKKSTAAQEGSSASLPQASVSERRSPSPSPSTSTSTIAAETDEPAPMRASGRTISITERARENARLRQQSQQTRMTAQTPPRGGRGRAIGSVRRESTRGARGRGGRGQSQ